MDARDFPGKSVVKTLFPMQGAVDESFSENSQIPLAVGVAKSTTITITTFSNKKPDCGFLLTEE